MKIFKIASFSLLGLLCLSMTRTAHAQWAFGPGSMEVQKLSVTGSYGAGCGDKACIGSVSYYGEITVKYTTNLHWTGDQPPIQGALILFSGSVDGQTTNPLGAATVTATSKVDSRGLQIKGTSTNGSAPYSAKPSDQQTKGPLFGQDLTANLYLQCTCDPYNQYAQSNKANAKINFTLQ